MIFFWKFVFKLMRQHSGFWSDPSTQSSSPSVAKICSIACKALHYLHKALAHAAQGSLIFHHNADSRLISGHAEQQQFGQNGAADDIYRAEKLCFRCRFIIYSHLWMSDIGSEKKGITDDFYSVKGFSLKK